MTLVQKIVAVHRALAAAELPHAFGGALALAWCTKRARGTIDIDVNVFVDTEQCDVVLAALSTDVDHNARQRTALARDGQVRLRWDETPVDIFLNTTPFHTAVMQRFRWERLGDNDLPFLACQDIAVFKAFFNRTKDWADLEEMQDAGTLDVGRVLGVLTEYLELDDERVRRLDGLRGRG
ncbi:MAG: hypothetical protein ACI8TX_000507 [Hyphomicrobiaceae bacterium]|jgi:hypothetical protein